MTEARTIAAARALNGRFKNPDVAAFNRARSARTERVRNFWMGVGHFLFVPYRGMGWTDDDLRRWRLIRGEAQ